MGVLYRIYLHILLLDRGCTDTRKSEPWEEGRNSLFHLSYCRRKRCLSHYHVIHFLETEDTVTLKWMRIIDRMNWYTHEEEGDGESNEPSHPDISPMILISIDTRECIDKSKTKEAKDEEGTKKRSTTKINHVVDVALRRGEMMDGWREMEDLRRRIWLNIQRMQHGERGRWAMHNEVHRHYGSYTRVEEMERGNAREELYRHWKDDEDYEEDEGGGRGLLT